MGKVPGSIKLKRSESRMLKHRRWRLISFQIRFLADPDLRFTKALDLSFDGAAIFGGDRSKRYALVVEDGAVKDAHVEADNTGLDVSAAKNVLGKLFKA